MRVAEYIIQRLADAGIDRAYLTYGGAISDLVDALPGRMAYTVAIHEQGGIFMAEGHAKASGGIGLVIATSGPGAGNLVTGLQNCYFDSVPLIALTGQVATRFMTPRDSKLRQLGFQECDVVGMVRPITKWAATIMDASAVGYSVDQALHKATEGRRSEERRVGKEGRSR